MQKFTRPITREIEIEGERVALTFDEKGVSARMVGSRREPVAMSWPAILCQAVSPTNVEPSAETLAQALENIRGAKKTPGKPTTSEVEAAPASPNLSEERAMQTPVGEQVPRGGFDESPAQTTERSPAGQ